VRHEFVVTHGGRWHDGAQSAMIGMQTAQWAQYIHDDLGVALAPRVIAEQVVAGVVAHLRDAPILPGAGAALERLAEEFILGLATSAAEAVAQTVLASTGWRKYFEVVVSADQVALGKPEPDVYLRALELLEADPSRTVAVEDSTNGIRSAHAARLAVIAIPNHEFAPDPSAVALASRVIPNLDALSAGIIREVLSDR
jgi:beta-phosphoglucomutase-like phosphatase (HAD superfamily)